MYSRGLLNGREWLEVDGDRLDREGRNIEFVVRVELVRGHDHGDRLDFVPHDRAAGDRDLMRIAGTAPIVVLVIIVLIVIVVPVPPGLPRWCRIKELPVPDRERLACACRTFVVAVAGSEGRPVAVRPWSERRRRRFLSQLTRLHVVPGALAVAV